MGAQEYAGSKSCSGCHKQIYDHWVTTPMGRALTPENEHLTLGGGVVTSERFQREFSVTVEDGRLVQTEAGAEFRSTHPRPGA